MIRRGGVIYVPLFLVGLEIKCLISQQHFTGCNYGLPISQLRVASHNTKFGGGSSQSLGIRLVPN